MIKVQVVFGRYTALDTVCQRCEGSGIEPTNGVGRCLFGCHDGVVPLPGRAYTYLAPDGTQLFDLLQGEVVSPLNGVRETKLVTVVSLTSPYQGSVREAYPVWDGDPAPAIGAAMAEPARRPPLGLEEAPEWTA